MSHDGNVRGEATAFSQTRSDAAEPPAITAATPAVPAVVPVPEGVASICEAIGRVFPDWRVWWHADTYYARRSGSWLEILGARETYAVWHGNPLMFLLMLDAQDRARPPGRWDAPTRHEPVLADLAKVGFVLETSPIDLARDVIAARIEADHPGWVVDHVITGWTAVWLDDPRYQLQAQSSAELKARLPPRGHAPHWRLG
jgi:hypothetical protein